MVHLDHLNERVVRRPVDLAGIVPDDEDTDATAIAMPTTKGGKDVRQDDVDDADVSQKRNSTESNRGFCERTGELLPLYGADLDAARPDRRSSGNRGTEDGRWHRLFDSIPLMRS